MRRLVLLVWSVIGIAVVPPVANSQMSAASSTPTAVDFKKLQAQCNAEAARPDRARPKAALDEIRRIVAAAEAEFRAFDGHVIDHTGRIARFGSVEVEAASASTEALKNRKLGDVPWRRVAYYWELAQNYENARAKKLTHVDPKTAPSIATSPHASLWVNRVENAFNAPLDQESVARNVLLKALTAGIDQLEGTIEVPRSGIDIEGLKVVLKEAVIRSSLTDQAWSAAFISAVIQQAGLPVAAFRQSASHVDYVGQALGNSRHMLTGNAANAAYRGCDVYATKARPGDMVCYHRAPDYDQAYAEARGQRREFETIARATYADSDNELPFSKSHCDIVVAVEASASKIVTIGGNVNQSVTRRRINTDAKGLLLRNQGPGCNPLTQRMVPQAKVETPDKTKFDSQAYAEQRRCNLNMQSWFVLLQHVDAAPVAD